MSPSAWTPPGVLPTPVPGPVHEVRRPAEDSSHDLVIGFVCAVFVPLVGFFVGLALAIRRQGVGAGALVMTVALVAVFGWALLFDAAGAFDGASPEEVSTGGMTLRECVDHPDTTWEQCQAIGDEQGS